MSESRKLLILGRSGQLSRALSEACEARGIAHERLGREQLDLSRSDDLDAHLDTVMQAQPPGAVIVNTAAYTRVDQAETDEDAAHQLNAAAPGVIARSAARSGHLVIHISTDFVFSGARSQPWTEDDQTAPINVYGRSKLAGEQAVLNASPSNLVIRTSWLLSEFPGNFLTSMLRLADRRDQVNVVADQTGTPTSVHELTRAILTAAGSHETGQRGGLYHFAGNEALSWADLADRIFKTAGRSVSVTPISTDAYGAPAPRPHYSALSSAAFEQRFGLRHQSLGAALKEIVGRIAPPDHDTWTDQSD